MSTTINSQLPNLASTLLQLTAQTQPGGASGSDPSDSSDLADTLNLSNSSISDLEQQAQQIAAENQSAALTTSEDAFQANLQAIAALSSGSSQSQAAQGAPDGSTVLGLVNGS